MTFSIIGTGNMAWFLASRLSAAAATVSGIYGRNKAASAQLADRYGLPLYASLQEILDIPGHCCILAISDQHIAEVSAMIPFRHTLQIHTSGTVALSALAAENRAVLWPVYSLIKNELPADLPIPVAWEADNTISRQLMPGIAGRLSSYAVEVTETQRQWLHLSAVVGNNFVNHLLAIVDQLCAEQQLPAALLHPIIEQTFLRARHASPAALQTGPARRGDQATMDRHLQLLQQHPEWQTLYTGIAASIKKMYEQQND